MSAELRTAARAATVKMLELSTRLRATAGSMVGTSGACRKAADELESEAADLLAALGQSAHGPEVRTSAGAKEA